jgi:hypothetical protein
MLGYNHLLSDVGELTEPQLLERMQQVHQKMNSAFALGKNDMVHQLNIMLDMYRQELSARQLRKAQPKEDGPDPFKSIDIG